MLFYSFIVVVTHDLGTTIKNTRARLYTLCYFILEKRNAM